MNTHAAWCAKGHRCALGEHRADPLTVTIPGAGRVVLIRVRTAAGREHAEVTVTLALAGDEQAARRQLATLAADLGHVLNRCALRRSA